jgi:hypothetical protein
MTKTKLSAKDRLIAKASRRIKSREKKLELVTEAHLEEVQDIETDIEDQEEILKALGVRRSH